MKIQVLSVDVTEKKGPKSTYKQAEVSYKDLDKGSVAGKKLLSFSNKDVFDTLANARHGMQFDVTSEKKGVFWEWTAVKALGDAPVTTESRTPSATPKSTYETAEERAARQVLIVRQSCLAQAVSTLKTEKVVPTKEDVMALATFYSDWVFQKESLSPNSNDGWPDDDIPM